MSGLRQLLGSRVFTVTAAVSIALSVGANAAIFSIVNALWLRPLPVARPAEMVVPYIPVVHSSDGEVLDNFSARSRESLESLDCFSAVTFQLSTAGRWGDWAPVIRLSDDGPLIKATAVSHDYFATLGVPVRGREFVQAEDRWGTEPVAIVSERFSRVYLSGAGEPVGVRLSTTRGPILIVGVADEDFHGARLGDDLDLWLPFGALGRFSDIASSERLEPLMPITMFARLAGGVGLETAQARIKTIIDRKATLRGLRDVAFSLRSESDLTRQSSLLRLLWTAAVLMLLLGSANLAALLLARTETRGYDLAVRLSLGARRAQLARLIIAEALILCVIGVLLGLLFRHWMLASIGSMPLPSGVRIDSLDLSLDRTVLLFSLGTALISTLIAAVSAIRRAMRTDVSVLLSATAPSTGRTMRTRQLLLGAHVALSIMLLIGAATLVLTVRRAISAEMGFAQDELLFVRVRPRLTQYMTERSDDAAGRQRDYGALMERAAALPNVAGVSYGSPLMRMREDLARQQVTDGAVRHELPLHFRSVGAGYLSTVGAKFLQGRDLTAADGGRAVSPQDVMMARVNSIRTGTRFRQPEGLPAVVVDRSFVEAVWPGQTAIGRTFTRGGIGITYEVVGVVERIGRDTRNAVETNAFEFQPLSSDDGTSGLSVVMRAREGTRAGDLKPAAIALVRQLFPDPALLQTQTVADIIAEERANERMGAWMFTWFGVASGILGLIGVYGLVAYVVARSRRELGIRSALGASHAHLARLSALRALKPLGAGLAAGVGAALLLTKLAASQTAGIAVISAPAYFIAVGAFLLAALVASLFGANGVRRVSPYEALRLE
ncbi:MAG: ABC transporter permease [Acidobacteriota bacterium]|nr:ABC transporter permease [Acidobacteriota bacterium]